MIAPKKFIRGICIRLIKNCGKGCFDMGQEKRKNKRGKTGRKVISAFIIFMVCAMIDGIVPVYGAEATVTFGSNWYEKGAGEEFPIGVYITGDETVGEYYVKVQYDEERMEYTGGGDRVEDGMIILEGTGDSDTVKYMLNFRATGGGEAGIRIYEASVSEPETGGGEEFHIAQMGAVPVTIEGENTEGISFLDRIAEEEAASANNAETEEEIEWQDEETENEGTENEETENQENGVLTAAGEAETEGNTGKPDEMEEKPEKDPDKPETGKKQESVGISIRKGIIVIAALAVFLMLDGFVILTIYIKRKRDIKRRKSTEEKEQWGFEFETIPDASASEWVEDAIARKNRLAGKGSGKVSFETVDFGEGYRK